MVAAAVAGKRPDRRGRNAGEADGLVRPGIEHGIGEHLHVFGDGDVLDVVEGIERVFAQPTHGLGQVYLGGNPLFVGTIAIGRDHDVLLFSHGDGLWDGQHLGEVVAAVGVVPLGQAKIIVQPETKVHTVNLNILRGAEVPSAHVGLHSRLHGIAHLCTHCAARCYQHDGKHNKMFQDVVSLHSLK